MHGWCSIDGDVRRLDYLYCVEDCSHCMAGAVLMVM